MPYSASALGVLPPLWSRAAKKPRPVLTFSDWVVFTFLILAPALRSWPRGMTGRSAGRSRPDGPNRAARPHVQAVPKFTGLCVREELEHRNAGNLPCVRQHLADALHARSPVTPRKKDRGAYAQVSVLLGYWLAERASRDGADRADLLPHTPGAAPAAGLEALPAIAMLAEPDTGPGWPGRGGAARAGCHPNARVRSGHRSRLGGRREIGRASRTRKT